VPDANFPLINSEKGLLDFDLYDNSPINRTAPLQLVALSGGNGRNIVPDAAECMLKCENPIQYLEVLKNQNQLNDQQLAYQIEANGLTIQATGKSAHAMTPEKGENAIDILINVLNLFGNDLSHEKFVQKYVQFIADDINGKKTSINSCDSISGELTFNIGKVLFDRQTHQITLNANVRHPVTMTGTRERVFTEMSAAGFIYEEIDYLPPLYFEQDEPFIKKLMGVYQSCTEDTIAAPLSIGGATFARAMKNAVCFGPLFPDEEELAHEANESLSLESFKKMTEIYIQALLTLMDGSFSL
jgi:succinyl-diaminopimelate desuccinylase